VAVNAAGALHNLACCGGGDVSSCSARRGAIVAAGALPPLLHLIESQAVGAIQAAGVLINLCARDELCGSRQAALMAAGGAAVLAAAARRPDMGVAARATTVLSFLAAAEGAGGGAARLDALIAAGVAAAVVQVARRPDAGAAAASEATRTLWMLAGGDDANAGVRRDAIVEAGGGRVAVRLGGSDPASRRQAFFACINLSHRCGGARLERLLAAGCAPALAAWLPAGAGFGFAAPAARALAQLAAGGSAAQCQRIATPACTERLVANLGGGGEIGFFAAAALAELARGGGEELRARIASAPSCLSHAAAALAIGVDGGADALPAAERVDRAADRLLCALGAARVLAAAAADGGALQATLRLALPGTAFAFLALRDADAWGAPGVSGVRWRGVWALAAGDDKAGALRLLRALKQLDATAYACISARPWLLFPELPTGEPAVAAQRFEDFAPPPLADG
jgi:hypothetical protein